MEKISQNVLMVVLECIDDGLYNLGNFFRIIIFLGTNSLCESTLVDDIVVSLQVSVLILMYTIYFFKGLRDWTCMYSSVIANYYQSKFV